MGRSEAEFGGSAFAICGVFFVGIEGDDDDGVGVTPFVCIPGGTGFLVLLAGGCVTTGATGAMMTKTHAAPKQLLFLILPLYMRIASSRQVRIALIEVIGAILLLGSINVGRLLRGSRRVASCGRGGRLGGRGRPGGGIR